MGPSGCTQSSSVERSRTGMPTTIVARDTSFWSLDTHALDAVPQVWLEYAPGFGVDLCYRLGQLLLTRGEDVAIVVLWCRAEYVQAELFHPLSSF